MFIYLSYKSTPLDWILLLRYLDCKANLFIQWVFNLWFLDFRESVPSKNETDKDTRAQINNNNH
jgi:hypothetical protein